MNQSFSCYLALSTQKSFGNQRQATNLNISYIKKRRNTLPVLQSVSSRKHVNMSLTWAARPEESAASSSPRLSSRGRLAAAAFLVSLSHRALSCPSPTLLSSASSPSRARAPSLFLSPAVDAPAPGGPAPSPCPGSVPEGPAHAHAPCGQNLEVI